MEYSSPIKINVVICGNMGGQTEYLGNKPDANREIHNHIIPIVSKVNNHVET